MRYTFLFIVPNICFTLIFMFGFYVIQNEEARIKAAQQVIGSLENRMCDNQRQVYRILSSGMRRRAVFADAYVTKTGDRPYGRELRRESAEIERIAGTITGCPAK